MKGTPSAGKLLLALIVGLLGLVIALSASPAQASHTKVVLTRSGRLTPETIVGFINGPTELVDVRVQDVDYPTGLGAFEFTITFNPIANVVSVVPGPFLGSTGRSVDCTPPDIGPNADGIRTDVNYSCNTLLNAPDGPQGSGVLATIGFQPGASFGTTSISFSKSHLLDVTGDIPLTHTAVKGSMLIAKCGDFNGDKAITVGDLLAIILRFGTNTGSANWDPRFDLDNNGAVTVGDLLIEVQEFGRACNA